MRVEAYAAFHPGESDVSRLPVLVGVGFTEQLLELIVADPAAALRWSDTSLFAPERPYSVLTASFAVADIARIGSGASARLDAVVGQLTQLGYDVRVMDVDLADRGEWRRVLVGEFATLPDAKAQLDRVHLMPAFADAEIIRH